MIIEVKELTRENIHEVLKQIKKSPKKTIAEHFGKLKRGIDGREYQKSVRREWD